MLTHAPGSKIPSTVPLLDGENSRLECLVAKSQWAMATSILTIRPWFLFNGSNVRQLRNERLRLIKKSALRKTEQVIARLVQPEEQALLLMSLSFISLTLRVLESTLLNLFMCPWNFCVMLNLSSVCPLSMTGNDVGIQTGKTIQLCLGHFRSVISSGVGLLSDCNKAILCHQLLGLWNLSRDP